MIKVYHNAGCSKSNQCLLFLEQSHSEIEIIDYLHQPPTLEELKALAQKLGTRPIGLVRVKESVWQEQFAGKALTDEEVLDVLLKHPALLERPIVVNGNKAVIARPLEKIAQIL